MKRCSKCILTERAVPIGSDGVCLFCRTDDGVIRYRGEQPLIELLERHRRLARERGADYDCMVTVSGGKDSMYALYALVTRYRLKPLAFNYSQGFVEPQATENLETGVRTLGVDLIRNTSNERQHRYLRHNLMALRNARPRQRRLVELLCTGCDTGYVDAAVEAARKHKIGLIVQGGCPVEPFLRGYLTSDVRIIAGSPRLSLLAEEVREYLGNLDLFVDPRYSLNLRHFCNIKGFVNRILPSPGRADDIERIHYFDYMPWNDSTDAAELERVLTWRRPPGRSTTMRFDCRLHILVDRFRILYQGFSEKEAIFSSMVRKKMITREEALERTEREIVEDERLVDQVIEEVVRTVGLEHRIAEIRRLWHPSGTAP
jgi:glucosamine--fructose-6-phosphate aminotransferase (isomerizing)